MSDKTNQHKKISDATYRAYSLRTFQLVKRWRRESILDDDGEYGAPILYVRWLSSLRPTLKPSSWHQYKAASILIMLEEPEWFWPLTEPERTRRAASILGAETQVGCTKKSLKTSSTKSKKITEADLLVLENYFSNHLSALAKPLINYFYFNRIAGLRPVEFANAHVVWDPQLSRLKLTVLNAKHDNIRAHGVTRTISFNHPTARFLSSALAFFQFAETELNAVCPEQKAQEWKRITKRMGDASAYANRAIWPKRTRHITLYSARHSASAFFKQHLLPEEVAALLGHATTETAYRNYARPVRKSGSKSPEVSVDNLPRPARGEVIRVRINAKHHFLVAAKTPRPKCG